MFSSDFWPPLFLSLQIASAATILVLIIGALLSRLMTVFSFKGKVVIETLLMLPLVLPPSVIGFLLIVIFGRDSLMGSLYETIFRAPLIFTWAAAMLASTVVAFPLMYQSCKAGFQSIDRDIEQAARVDGANEWKVFLFITLPLAYKSIVTGIILSFARAIGEFGATLMFAGNIPGKTQTVSTAIYIALETGKMAEAWMWAASLIVISFLMLLMVQKMNY